VSPRKQTELFDVVFLHEAKHKPYESDAVEAKRKEAMVSNKHSEIILECERFLFNIQDKLVRFNLIIDQVMRVIYDNI
jgi:hypothetical protein